MVTTLTQQLTVVEWLPLHNNSAENNTSSHAKSLQEGVMEWLQSHNNSTECACKHTATPSNGVSTHAQHLRRRECLHPHNYSAEEMVWLQPIPWKRVRAVTQALHGGEWLTDYTHKIMLQKRVPAFKQPLCEGERPSNWNHSEEAVTALL